MSIGDDQVRFIFFVESRSSPFHEIGQLRVQQCFLTSLHHSVALFRSSSLSLPINLYASPNFETVHLLFFFFFYLAKIFCWKRCSPRFLRKTRETLQKEHQDKLTKQQREEEEVEKKRLEEKLSKERKEEARYDKDPTLIVRPGKKSKVPKVSVAIDATPAARTESILNQMPIELAKGVEPGADSFNKSIDYPVMIDPSQLQTAPQVVVIEHHHSKSDPLPMENVLKSVKPNFSTPRIYESDSGSTSSLYAKINPKLKSRLPRPGELPVNRDGGSAIDQGEDIYMKMGPKLTTFGANGPLADTCDINVTCREPSPEKRECASPEEALRTIKRRNYPKVLPDIEKRRSLPAPGSLFASKQGAGSLKDYRSGFHSSHQPPQPPPRTFGPSKSLEFAEESENQSETETIVTNLHVGPLLRRQDYTAKNNSDPSIIDSLDEKMDNRSRVQSGGGSVDTIYSGNAGHEIGQPIFQSVGKDIGNPIALLQAGIGNPNWYKSTPTGNGDICIGAASSEPRITIREVDKQPQFGGSNWDTRIEPRIVITPRVGNLLGQNQSSSRTVMNLSSGTDSDERLDGEIKPAAPIYESNQSAATPSTSIEQSDPSCSSPDSGLPSVQAGQEPRKEPRIIITARDTKGSSSLKQPKIIIKPTSSSLQRSRDHRNIPKVSAIPSPEQSCQSCVDKSGEQREKPPLKEKPKITRIPSFSRRVDEASGGIERAAVPSYPEKAEIVHRVEAVASGKVVNVTVACDGRSSIPTLQRKEGEKCSSIETGAGALNTATIKKKPAGKK